MAKPSQSVQKRQRELKKHRRRLEKERRKAERMADKDSGDGLSAEGPDIREYFEDPEGSGDNESA